MSASNKPTLHLDHSGAIVLATFGPEGEGKKETEWTALASDEHGKPMASRIRITVERMPDET